jgi:hypothetical protein
MPLFLLEKEQARQKQGGSRMVTKEQVKAVWKCRVEGCNYTAAPTVEGYNKLTGHQLAHRGLPKEKRGFQLVDESTGEVLAQKLEEATIKGFITTKPPEPTMTPVPPPALETKPETPPLAPEIKPASAPAGEPQKLPEAEPLETEDRVKVEITTVKTAGIFTYEITLPSDAYTLFNLAKACELETDGEKSFDEWVWDCIRARFTKDYKKQLILAPVEV